MFNLRIKLIITLVLFSLILSACGEKGSSSSPSSAEQALTQVAQNVSTGLTQTAASIAASQPESTATILPAETSVVPTEMPTLSVPIGSPDANQPTPSSADMTAMPSGQETAVAPPVVEPTKADVADCKLRVSLEYENIPDDTELGFNKKFTKTWRLKNVGTCEWPAGTELMFISGEIMGASSRIVLLTKALYPNQYVEVKIDFKAPKKAGTYQSNWMLVTPEGHVFGTGENGKGTFWVRIIAYDKATVTQKTP